MERIIAPYTVTIDAADVAPATGTPGYATDGNPATNVPATLWPAYQYNAIQEEIMSFILGAGLDLDRNDNGQMLKALQSMTIMALPTAPALRLSNNIFAEDRQQILTWRTLGTYTGYISPEVGCISFGTQPNPRPFEVDLIGQTLDKTDAKYAALHAWATAAGLFVTSGAWTAGTYFFAEMGGNLFKVPDLRNMFIRFTGTDIDTANVRVLGSKQLDALQNIVGQLSAATDTGIGLLPTGAFKEDLNSNVLRPNGATTPATTKLGFDASRVARTSAETRALNTAFHPRMFL